MCNAGIIQGMHQCTKTVFSLTQASSLGEGAPRDVLCPFSSYKKHQIHGDIGPEQFPRVGPHMGEKVGLEGFEAQRMLQGDTTPSFSLRHRKLQSL